MTKQTFAVGALSALLALSACQNDSRQNENNHNATNSTQKPQALFSTSNLASSYFTIDAQRDTILLCPKGSLISYKKNSIVDANGRPVAQAKLEVKEALQMKDIVQAGLITMSNNDILQTGGMLYINAQTPDNKPLKIAEGQSIGIAMPTENMVEGMQLYKGDVDANGNINWVSPEDKLVPMKLGQEKENKANKQHDNIPTSKETVSLVADNQLVMPVKPQKLKEDDDRLLYIDFVNKNAFPELQQFHKVQFRVKDNCEFHPEDGDITWHSVEVGKGEKEGEYSITFTRKVSKTETFTRHYQVVPVFEGKDYEKAMAEYEQKFKEIETRKKEIAKQEEEDRKKREEERKKQQELAKAAAKKAEEERAKNLADYLERNKEWIEKQKKYTEWANAQYSMQIENFGWYNCDRLVPNLFVYKKIKLEMPQEFKDLRFTYIYLDDKIQVMSDRNPQNSYYPIQKQRLESIGGSADDSFTWVYGSPTKTNSRCLIFVTYTDQDGSFYAGKTIVASDNEFASIKIEQANQDDFRNKILSAIN